MRPALTALTLLALCAPAAAADAPPPAKGAPGTNVEMPYLMAPLTNADKLIGYAYISTHLTATSDVSALAVRDRLAFVQDAFVRDVNREGVAMAADPEHIDISAVESRLLASAQQVMGAGKVKQIIVCTVQIAELHPGQTVTPDKSDDSKVLDAHGNPLKSRCDS